jgi:hypothetical protein
MYRETSYFYHRDGSYDVTFAYQRADDHVLFGAAFCNPKDQFSKSMGRRIAEGRMGSIAVEAIPISPESTRFQVHDMLVSALSNYPSSPSLIKE